MGRIVTLIVVDNSDEEMEEDDINSWDVIFDDMVRGEEHSSSPTAPGSSPITQPSQSSEKTVKLQSWHALQDKVASKLHVNGMKGVETILHIVSEHWYNTIRFEVLPLETRGGRANMKSLMNDESVQTGCLAWLRVQKKDVYMDGHEQEDVKYHTDVFLPKMAEFEVCMTRYEAKIVPATEPGSKPVTALEPVEPQLPSGVKKVIAYFHDECCFHALDYMRSPWLAEGQTVLQKKS
ncbi:hypothetical protein C8R45DRAFT_937374 [Mycena sanguinolenta]|nr:hypothetical protein C8R45DRAFT_937374 [Mycena sanguinolenta]